MSRNEKDSFLPSYEESVNSRSTPASRFQVSHIQRTSSPLRGQQILDNLTLARSQHIRIVTDTLIIPLVEQRALYGIAQTTIAMIPSDVPLQTPETEKSEFSFDTSNEKKVEVIGFSSDDEPQIVRLEGQSNRTEFWRPQSITTELERVLNDRLNANSNLRSPSPKRAQPEVIQVKQKRNFFGRMADAMNQGERSPSGNPEVGVRQMDNVGQVLVEVGLEELCLRTVNDFGLYDTMSRQCVIIRVDAGC